MSAIVLDSSQLLATIRDSTQQAWRWIAVMPSLTDAEIRRLGGIVDDEAYIAEVVAVRGKEAA